MHVRELNIADAYEFTPRSFPDHRGRFVAPFQEETFAETLGHSLNLAQVNHSVSKRGVIRGVHFADVPPGQGKYIYCARGALLDVVVDVRVGSPTFGTFESVRLDDVDCRAVYVAEGLGHAFLALAEDTVAIYLCSTAYNPAAEHGVNPLDPQLALPWGELAPVLSEKDRDAPTLVDAEAQGLLPRYEDCLRRYRELRLTG